MSETQQIGIDAARKILGPLVRQVIADDANIVLTRNGEPVARIVRYTPEDTVRQLGLSDLAAAVIATARTAAGMTAAEFDYDIAVHFDASTNGIGGEFSPLGNAAYLVANRHLPEVQPGDGDEFLAVRTHNRDQLWADLQGELRAYAQRCRDRKYTGWSAAARAAGKSINYAD